MPTIQQLVRKGRVALVDKSKSPALDSCPQRQKYIPRVCAGETMSMDLTEPDAGSDLQRVMLGDGVT